MAEDAAVVGQIPTTEQEQEQVLAPQAAQDADPDPIKALPTDRLTHTKQVEALKAWAIRGANGRPVTNSEIADLTKFNASTIAYNNAFFGECQLITKGGNGHTASPELIEYGRAVGFDDEKAGHKLANLFRKTWFGELIMPKVLYRPITEKEAITDLGIACRANKQKHEVRLRLLLDYLQFAGLVIRDGGMVSVGPTAKEQRRIPDQATQEGANSAPATLPPRENVGSGQVITTFNSVPEGRIQFSVNVDVPLSEMATWRPEVVAAFFAGVAQVVSAKAAVERAMGGSSKPV